MVSSFNKKAGMEGLSLASSYVLYDRVNDSIDHSDKVMDLAVKAFENSGAENLEYSGKNITNFYFSLDKFDCNEDYSVCNLKTPLDFSSVPDFLVNAGTDGMYVALGSALGGLALELLSDKYLGKDSVSLAIRTAGRFGTAYGLAQTMAAKTGLSNLDQFTVEGATKTHTFVQYSQLGNGVDIAPAVESGLEYLTKAFQIGLGVGLGVEAVRLMKCLKTYLKNKPSSEQVKDYKRPGINQQPKGSDVKFVF